MLRRYVLKFLSAIARTFFLSFIIAHPVIAQNSRLYTTEFGLISSHINSLYIDNNGFLWISTLHGMCRFDGQNFKSFKYDPLSQNWLNNENVNRIYQDIENKYWVCTGNGLQHFDLRTNSFESIAVIDDDPESAISISAIIQNSFDSKLLFVGTMGRGLVVLDSESKRVDKTMTNYYSDIQHRNVRDLFVDSNYRLWIIYERDGFGVLDLRNRKRMEILTDPEDKTKFASMAVNVVVEDTITGSVFLGTEAHGIFRYDNRTGSFVQLEQSLENKINIISLLVTGKGELLVGGENSGLWVCDVETGKLRRYEINNSSVNLERSKVHDLIEDNQGNLWVAIFQKGLLQLPGSKGGFLYSHVSGSPEQKNVASNTSMIIDDEGRFWVGTDGGGIFVMEGNRLITNYNTLNSGLSTNSIMWMERGDNKDIWIATYGGGLYLFRDGRIIRPAGSESLTNTRIMTLEWDIEEKKLYIGTYGEGAMIYDTRNERIINFGLHLSDWISVLYIDNDTLLWIGAVGRTYCYKRESGELMFDSILERVEASSYYFVETSDTIWMATSRGLVGFDKSSGQIEFFGNGQGLEENEVQALALMDDNLWMSLRNGIACLHLETGQVTNFSTYTSSLVGEFRYGSVLSDGYKLIFGGDNGLVEFYPELMKKEKPVMKNLYLTSFKIHNQEIDYNISLEEDNVLDSSVFFATRANLTHRDNSFTLGFSTQEYTSPFKISYQYKLENYDSDWRNAMPYMNFASYSNLKPGDYIFKARAFINGNYDQAINCFLNIKIAYPWYSSPLFRLLYLSVFIILMFVLYTYQRTKILNKRKIVEMEREERVKEAKLRLFIGISHEIRTPLTLILSPLKKLAEKEKDENKRSLYELMRRNAERILLLVNQLMDMSKLDDGKMRLSFVETNLLELIKNAMMSYSNIATARKVSFSLECVEPEALMVWVDPFHFDKIVYNILSNAFKFTPQEGKVLIRVNCESNERSVFNNPRITEYVEIKIFNTGTRIRDEELELIFDRFFQGSNSTVLGSGIGLNLARQLTELHHGQIFVRNIDDSGVEFTFRIPLGNAHLSEIDLQQCEQCTDSFDQEHMLIKTFTPDTDDNKQLVGSKEGQRKMYTILVVDDDEEFCGYVSRELENYNVVICNNGQKAWKYLLVNSPDVVVTDLVMSNGDGLELCQRIKSNPNTDHIPVIVLTAESGESAAEKSIQCMVDRCLNKPLNIKLLQGAIGQSIRVRENIRKKMHRMEMGFEYTKSNVDSLDTKFIKKVTEIVSQNYRNPGFSVEDLSKAMGMSRVNLNRKLKESIGLSPSSLIKTVRLKQSAYLLVNSNVNISEAAYMVGFSSPSYFSNTFNSFFGMTPKEFVMNYMDNSNEEEFRKRI